MIVYFYSQVHALRCIWNDRFHSSFQRSFSFSRFIIIILFIRLFNCLFVRLLHNFRYNLITSFFLFFFCVCVPVFECLYVLWYVSREFRVWLVVLSSHTCKHYQWWWRTLTKYVDVFLCCYFLLLLLFFSIT